MKPQSVQDRAAPRILDLDTVWIRGHLQALATLSGYPTVQDACAWTC